LEEEEDSESVDEDAQIEDVRCERNSEEDATFCRSLCPCAVCHGVNEAVVTWDVWVPENEAEVFIRAHVEKVMMQTNSLNDERLTFSQ
jgi:hypothetical protein